MKKTTKKAAPKPATGGNPSSDMTVKVDEVSELLGQVGDIIRICVDCTKEIEAQRTERVRLEGEFRERIEDIQRSRDVMITFLDRTFEERRENFAALFDRLDTALDQGNIEATNAVLGALVDYAKTSPFEALRDVAQAQAALKDKNKTWEF